MKTVGDRRFQVEQIGGFIDLLTKNATRECTVISLPRFHQGFYGFDKVEAGWLKQKIK